MSAGTSLEKGKYYPKVTGRRIFRKEKNNKVVIQGLGERPFLDFMFGSGFCSQKQMNESYTGIDEGSLDSWGSRKHFSWVYKSSLCLDDWEWIQRHQILNPRDYTKAKRR